MSHIIQDGRGTKQKAEVDSTGKLQVRSVSEPSSIEALDKGDQYFLHSAVMNFSNANNSYIGFIKNDEPTLNLIITAIEYAFEPSLATGPVTNPDQNAVIRIRRNPVGPSIAQNWSTNNVDFGSANTLLRTAVTAGFGSGGANDQTFTDNGALILHDLIQCDQAGFKKLLVDQLKLRPGNSVGFGFQPPVNNIDMNIHINVVCYLKD
jgi:hypothetical protein